MEKLRVVSSLYFLLIVAMGLSGTSMADEAWEFLTRVANSHWSLTSTDADELPSSKEAQEVLCSLRELPVDSAIGMDQEEPQSESPRLWTDLTGNFQTSATFLGLSNEGKSVHLKNEKGNKIEVALEKFCEQDQLYAKIAEAMRSGAGNQEVELDTLKTVDKIYGLAIGDTIESITEKYSIKQDEDSPEIHYLDDSPSGTTIAVKLKENECSQIYVSYENASLGAYLARLSECLETYGSPFLGQIRNTVYDKERKFGEVFFVCRQKDIAVRLRLRYDAGAKSLTLFAEDAQVKRNTRNSDLPLTAKEFEEANNFGGIAIGDSLLRVKKRYKLEMYNDSYYIRQPAVDVQFMLLSFHKGRCNNIFMSYEDPSQEKYLSLVKQCIQKFRLLPGFNKKEDLYDSVSGEEEMWIEITNGKVRIGVVISYNRYESSLTVMAFDRDVDVDSAKKK